MSWTNVENSACYDGEGENTLSVQSILTPGKYYHVEVELEGTGSVQLGSFEGQPEITADYSEILKAIQSSLVLKGSDSVCISNLIITEIFEYVIKDSSGNIVYTSINTDVEGSGTFLRYSVDWSSLQEGCYTIEMNDGIEYVSECFYVKLDHDCTILLTWTNQESAFGFEYSGLDFTQSLRIAGKLWQPKYNSDIKETFVDSKGNRKMLYARVVKDQLLTVNEIPEYLHDALSIGLNHDTFKIGGVDYVFEETDINPQWRNSSNLAPVLLRVLKKSQNLINNNCG